MSLATGPQKKSGQRRRLHAAKWFETSCGTIRCHRCRDGQHHVNVGMAVPNWNNSQQWLALDIEAVTVIDAAATRRRLSPAATNLQALGGISFKKGC